MLAKGSDSVAWLACPGSHVRAVVATLGGSHGAAGRTDKWRHLYSGFSIWLSQTEATGKFAFTLYQFIYLSQTEATVINLFLAGQVVSNNFGPTDLLIDIV